MILGHILMAVDNKKLADELFRKKAITLLSPMVPDISKFLSKIDNELPALHFYNRDITSLTAKELALICKATEKEMEEEVAAISAAKSLPKNPMRKFHPLDMHIKTIQKYIEDQVAELYPNLTYSKVEQMRNIVRKFNGIQDYQGELTREKLQDIYDVAAGILIDMGWRFGFLIAKWNPDRNEWDDKEWDASWPKMQADMTVMRKRYREEIIQLFADRINVIFKVFGKTSSILYELSGGAEDVLIEKTLDLGADINLVSDSRFGNTPLIWSIANAANNTAMLLLNRGEKLNLDVNRKDTVHSGNALALVIAKGHKERKEFGIPSSFVVAQKLVEMHANPNLTDIWGNTALHLACARREEAVIMLLLGAGADMTIRNADGKTPLEMLDLAYTTVEKLIIRQTTVKGDPQICHTLIKEEFDAVDVNKLKEKIAKQKINDNVSASQPTGPVTFSTPAASAASATTPLKPALGSESLAGNTDPNKKPSVKK